MTTFRRLGLGALSLLTLAAVAACGSTGPAAGSRADAGLSASAAGRKMGYDYQRYQRVLAPKANKQHLPRRFRLPESVDLRKNCAPIYDQGQLGSCTAFAVAKGLREFNQHRDNERIAPLSALFQYYETRLRMDSIGEDSGGTITDSVRVLKEVGAAEDSLWPYDIAKFKLKPPAAAYDAASEYKVKSGIELYDLDDVKTALAEGKSVAFGFLVYRSFMGIGQDGVMPIPGLKERMMGGHAVLAVGYDDAKQMLIVRNSWGSGWGDHGYFYMPYAYAANPQKTMDLWVAN